MTSLLSENLQISRGVDDFSNFGIEVEVEKVGYDEKRMSQPKCGGKVKRERERKQSSHRVGEGVATAKLRVTVLVSHLVTVAPCDHLVTVEAAAWFHLVAHLVTVVV